MQLLNDKLGKQSPAAVKQKPTLKAPGASQITVSRILEDDESRNGADTSHSHWREVELKTNSTA